MKATPSEHLINLVGVIIVGMQTSLKLHAAKIIMTTKIMLTLTMVTRLMVTLTIVYIYMYLL